MLCDSSDSNYQINESEPGERLEPDVSPALADLVSKGLLLIGPPNTGKTTVLRELARLLSLGRRRVVVIVDKSMEIAGTGIKPHAAIGHARVLTCHTPSEQHRVMLEAVENQSPDVVIVDELPKEDSRSAHHHRPRRGRRVCPRRLTRPDRIGPGEIAPGRRHRFRHAQRPRAEFSDGLRQSPTAAAIRLWCRRRAARLHRLDPARGPGDGH